MILTKNLSRSAPMLKAVLKDWKADIHNKIPTLLDAHIGSFTQRWNTYHQSLGPKLMEISPAMATMIDRRLHSLNAINITMVNDVTQALKSYKSDAATAHPKLRESLQESFNVIFKEALEITGKS